MMAVSEVASSTGKGKSRKSSSKRCKHPDSLILNISDTATTLAAGNNLNITAGQNTSSQTSFTEKKESGFLSGGGMGISIGSRQQSTDNKGHQTAAAASTVGAITGNVTLVAGQAYKQVGSDVVAPAGDVNILAKKVDIIEARETSSSTTEQKFKQSGITLSISNPVISAIQSAQGMAQAASQTSSGRMQALAGAAVALQGYNTYSALTDKAGDFSADKAKDISVSISLGTSKSQSLQQSQSDTARGSSVTGNNVNITATGDQQNSNILIQGSDVKAANNVTLTADNQINLIAAKNTASSLSTNSASSSSIGVSISSQSGVGITLSASRGRGNADGNDASFTNTQIAAGNTASITSGGDTSLKGAVVAANQIKADVGGSLNIESLQDSSTYTSRQQSAGGSITFSPAGVPTGASISASRSNINSNFANVNEQSGLKAGDAGFAVNVGGNTDLKGGVIASTQTAVDTNSNSFTTGGALTTSDLQNTASYSGRAGV